MATSDELRLKKINELSAVTGDIPLGTSFPALIPTSTEAKKITLEQISPVKQIARVELTSNQLIGGTSETPILSLVFTPTSASSILIIDCAVNGIATVSSASNYGIISFGWGGVAQQRIATGLAPTSTSPTTTTGGSASNRFVYQANHNGLGNTTRTYVVYARQNISNGGNLQINWGGGISSLNIIEITGVSL